MADTNINFRVGMTGAQKTASEMEKVSTSITKVGMNSQRSNMTLMSMSRIVQDMPFGFMAVGNNITFMAEQMAYARTQGVSFGAQMKGMLGALAGPGGMIFAISAVTSAITYFTMNTRKGASAVDNFTSSVDKAIKKLIDFQDPFKDVKFGLEPGQIDQLTAQLDNRIKQLQDFREQALKTYGASVMGVNVGALQQALGVIEAMPKEMKDLLTQNERLAQNLKEQKATYEAQRIIAEMLNSLGLKRVDNEKEANKQLKDQLDTIKEIFSEASKPSRAGRQTVALGAGMTPIEGPENMIIPDKIIKDKFNMVQDLTHITAITLRDEFTAAWQSVFGEANSLFEKFAMRISEYFTQMALQNAASGLFSLIFPGAGTVSGIAGGSNKPINIILDGEKVGSFVDSRVPYSINRATRLDIL